MASLKFLAAFLLGKPCKFNVGTEEILVVTPPPPWGAKNANFGEFPCGKVVTMRVVETLFGTSGEYPGGHFLVG